MVESAVLITVVTFPGLLWITFCHFSVGGQFIVEEFGDLDLVSMAFCNGSFEYLPVDSCGLLFCPLMPLGNI